MTATEPPEIDEDGLVRLLAARDPGPRTIVAIAGAPGSGKSTVAEAVVAKINAQAPGMASVLPMDGYHYDDILLDEMGTKSRKGAPHTFDVGGLAQMLARLRADSEDFVAVPVFDRRIEIARAGARLVPRSARVIVVEGNYLLLSKAPWPILSDSFNLTVRIDVPDSVLRDRLTRRWQFYGLTPDQIRAKLDDNDLPNGRLVTEASRRPDYRIVQTG